MEGTPAADVSHCLVFCTSHLHVRVAEGGGHRWCPGQLAVTLGRELVETTEQPTLGCAVWGFEVVQG